MNIKIQILYKEGCFDAFSPQSLFCVEIMIKAFMLLMVLILVLSLVLVKDIQMQMFLL